MLPRGGSKVSKTCNSVLQYKNRFHHISATRAPHICENDMQV